nr:probable indole-3-pyruvate monooxygenase YUCCA5 [Tanacetum cinerariifolium]
ETDFIAENGYPYGWKGKQGIYAAGFTREGLEGVYNDAVKICEDVYKVLYERMLEI